MSETHDGAATAATEDTLHDANLDDAQNETSAAEHLAEPGDDAAAETPAPAKPRQTAQERINELTAARREAERDRDFYREQALRNGNGQQPAQEAQQPQPQEASRPHRDDYSDDFEYIEALTDWKAEQAAERLTAHARQQDQARTTRQTFETRKAALFPQGEPEGLQQFLRIPQLPVAVIEIVGESDIGPKIADHLGANPAELRRLEGMSPIQQARELTRLEHRLTPPARATPKTVTDAPEPPPQARGAGGRFGVAPDTTDFAAFEKLADG
jgi:hypothetical protein